MSTMDAMRAVDAATTTLKEAASAHDAPPEQGEVFSNARSASAVREFMRTRTRDTIEQLRKMRTEEVDALCNERHIASSRLQGMIADCAQREKDALAVVEHERAAQLALLADMRAMTDDIKRRVAECENNYRAMITAQEAALDAMTERSEASRNISYRDVTNATSEPAS